MAAILVTLQVSSNATTHEIITSSCREDEKLSTGGKIFSKYCDMSKNARERIHQPSLPPPALYNGSGMPLRVCPRIPDPSER